MSNECWRVIMLHALIEIRRISQIEENIFKPSVCRPHAPGFLELLLSANVELTEKP